MSTTRDYWTQTLGNTPAYAGTPTTYSGVTLLMEQAQHCTKHPCPVFILEQRLQHGRPAHNG